jgi:hypothetical protein
MALRLIMLLPGLLLAFVLAGEVLSQDREPREPAPEAEPRPAEKAAESFRAVDLWVDSGESRLAAYQVVVTYDKAAVEIVGVEGGATPGFESAPFFDEAGKNAGRIVLAAFTRDAKAVAGRKRLGRLHLMVTGKPEFEIKVEKVVTAAKIGGDKIEVAAELKASVGNGDQ